MEKSGAKVVAALETNEDAPVALQPGEVALDDLAVPSEFRLRLDARAGDTRVCPRRRMLTAARPWQSGHRVLQRPPRAPNVVVGGPDQPEGSSTTTPA